MNHKKNNSLPVAVFIETELSLGSSVQELHDEAAKLFKILDNNAATIRNLEKSLQELSANFPFRMLIKEDPESFPKPPEDYHKTSAIINLMSYCTKVCWFLSWDYDEKSKKFRLLVVSEEEEVIHFNYLDGNDDFDTVRTRTFQANCKSKTPLIETNIQTRLDYYKYLPQFVSEFKSHLQNMRKSIEAGISIWSS